jgi:broad specificity phosphatase PhoE
MTDYSLFTINYMVQKTLYIIRHGQTDLNKQGIIQGRGINTDLNDEGRKQAAAFFKAYKSVPFDKIYVSELKRTQQTVQKFIDLGIPYERLAGLDELAWGIHEGEPSTPENRAAFKEIMLHWLEGRLDEKFENGESPNDVLFRQKEALATIMSHPEEETVLICMHGRAMRLFLCLLTDVPLTKMEEFPHQNVILYKVTYDGEKFVIADFNNSNHLKNIATDL